MVTLVQKSILSLVGDKSWRLLAVLLLFSLAVALVRFTNYMFTLGHHMRVNLFLIVPMVTCWVELKTFYYF